MILEVIDIIEEAHEAKTIRLATPTPINFKPGQYVTVTMNINGEDVVRAYSISSSPNQKEYIELTFQLVPDGKMTPKLYELKKGDKLQIEGPFGDFYYDDSMQKIVIIAGGCGIAPFRSMLEYIRDNNKDVKISLLYSCRKKNNIIFKEEMEKLAEELGINYYLTLTRDEKWEGHRGRIDKEVLEKQDLSSMFMLCGPEPMIKTMKKDLEELGVPEEQIKAEEW